MSTALRFLIEYPVVLGVLAAVLFSAFRLSFVPADRKRCEWFLAASALALPAAGSCDALTRWMSHLAPMKLDLYILRFDGLFGQPSFLLGQFVSRHFWLEAVSNMTYNALPCAVLAVFASYLWLRSEAETLAVLRTFILNLFLAIPIYLLIPACGPAYTFPAFPLLPAHFAAHPIALGGPANCVPSVHTSTALLVLYFAWRWRVGRALGIAYLALIVVATLGSGQHYLFDLLAAVPYAALVFYLGKLQWIWLHATGASDQPQLTGAPTSRCIPGVSVRLALYTPVHTIAQRYARNSLIYKVTASGARMALRLPTKSIASRLLARLLCGVMTSNE